MKNKLTNREIDKLYSHLSNEMGIQPQYLNYAEDMIQRAYWGKKNAFPYWRANKIKENRDYRNYLYPIFTSFIKEGGFNTLMIRDDRDWSVFEARLKDNFSVYEHQYFRNKKINKIKNEIKNRAIGNIVYSIQQKKIMAT